MSTPRERKLLGYFEEFLLHLEGVSWPKGLGNRLYPVELPPEQAGRPLGYAGRREMVLTEPFTLQKGHKEVTYRASVKKPFKVSTMLQRMEGREVENA